MTTESDDPPRLTRRRLFRVGLAGAVGLGAGGVLAWQTSGYDVPDAIARRLRSLSPKEYRIVEAVAERIVRDDDGRLPPPDEVDTALWVDAVVSSLHAADQRDVRHLLHLLEHALPPWSGRFARFTRLSGPGRDAVLEAMQGGDSPLLRAGFEGLKALVALAYFRDERTWAAIGYDGPLVGRARLG